jgi:hypothetical protein
MKTSACCEKSSISPKVQLMLPSNVSLASLLLLITATRGFQRHRHQPGGKRLWRALPAAKADELFIDGLNADLDMMKSPESDIERSRRTPSGANEPVIGGFHRLIDTSAAARHHHRPLQASEVGEEFAKLF